jgi:DNA-binding NarL/FixJ family response regulator
MVPPIVRSKITSKRKAIATHFKEVGEPLRVYISEQNHLAAQYLLHILERDKTLEPVLLEDLVLNRSAGRTVVIFIVDDNGIDLPLRECLHVLRQKCPEAKFIVLDQEMSTDGVIELLTLGVQGFVAYPQVCDQLEQAVHGVAQGKMWVPATVLEEYVQRSIQLGKNGIVCPVGPGITQRESQVMELVKRRLSNKEIAGLLCITESTVKFHLSNILSKMQVNRRGELLNKDHVNEVWRKLIAS